MHLRAHVVEKLSNKILQKVKTAQVKEARCYHQNIEN